MEAAVSTFLSMCQVTLMDAEPKAVNFLKGR